jgi:hypothetical protein
MGLLCSGTDGHHCNDHAQEMKKLAERIRQQDTTEGRSSRETQQITTNQKTCELKQNLREQAAEAELHQALQKANSRKTNVRMKASPGVTSNPSESWNHGGAPGHVRCG